MKVLGIETSCDETAAAIVEDGCQMLSNQIASQVDIHARYGGIVPEVASRQHTLSIVPVIERAMTEAGVTWNDLGGIAVTMGPGLAGSLLTGVNIAKAISLARGLPITGVNHLEGHIYANWLTGAELEFPLVCLIVSGGHSDLVLVRGHDRPSSRQHGRVMPRYHYLVPGSGAAMTSASAASRPPCSGWSKVIVSPHHRTPPPAFRKQSWMFS